MSDTELMAESQPRLPGETPERDSHGGEGQPSWAPASRNPVRRHCAELSWLPVHSVAHGSVSTEASAWRRVFRSTSHPLTRALGESPGGSSRGKQDMSLPPRA